MAARWHDGRRERVRRERVTGEGELTSAASPTPIWRRPARWAARAA